MAARPSCRRRRVYLVARGSQMHATGGGRRRRAGGGGGALAGAERARGARSASGGVGAAAAERTREDSTKSGGGGDPSGRQQPARRRRRRSSARSLQATRAQPTGSPASTASSSQVESVASPPAAAAQSPTVACGGVDPLTRRCSWRPSARRRFSRGDDARRHDDDDGGRPGSHRPRAPLVARQPALAAVDVRGATWRPTRRCTPPECAPTAAAAPSPGLDLDVETSIVDDDETHRRCEAASPKGWLSSWLWGKD